VQEQLPLTVLLVDDGGYGILRYDQQRAGDAERGVDLAGPDWPALASAFGIRNVQPALPQLAAAITEAAITDGPTLVHLRATLTPPRTTSPRWFD
jgi:acetolactate synthase-1/2/3 large subunit